MRKSLFICLALLLAIFLLPMNAQAAEIVASGECGENGDNLTWTLDSDGLLTISGNGDMHNYYNNNVMII